jgi:hypothetical protein
MCQMILVTEGVLDTPGAYAPGEIVAVVEDSHQFSPLELAHPRWRVMRVPGLPASALEALVLPYMASLKTHRKAQRAHPDAVAAISALPSPITLPPRQAMEILTTFEARDGN